MPDDSGAQPLNLDTTTPHQARIWNYLLGGKDNYPVDRAAAEQVRERYPAIVDIARRSRNFLGRAVTFLAKEEGIRQFLDVGTGLPTVDNTHEMAQRVAPESRIVYVDNDPLVYVHAQALLTSHPLGACAYIQADARQPETILTAAAETLDFSRPIALIVMGVMGTVADDARAYSIMDTFVRALPSGRFLVFEDGTAVVHPEAATAAAKQTGYQYRLRTPQEFARFFDGLQLLEPGIVSVSRWRPEATPWEVPDEVDAFCGVGRKP
ncbi:SAM-dependent methyltransferase [Thermopolyspora sp. NPDC052614]|uniref:SAM-dependent methyltransferase n=1 Tax=Thermopolyspora sp. NPDC052614 TaxID=3155682 RepID=UPI003428319A